MSLLVSLGLNSTILYQFLIFLITYIFMYFLVFKPYFQAYGKREENTVGNHESNERILEEANELQVQFESKTRDVNSEYKKIYSQARTKALEEYDSIIQKARNEAKSIMEEAQKNIEVELQNARAQLVTQAPLISKEIQTKILSS